MPRHRPEIRVVDTFEEALAWFCASNVYWRPAPVPWFDSERERLEHTIAVDETWADELSAILVEHGATVGPDAEVVCDAHGNASLVFVASADAVIEVFGPMLRVSENAASSRIADATRALLARAGAPLARFEETRRTPA